MTFDFSKFNFFFLKNAASCPQKYCRIQFYNGYIYLRTKIKRIPFGLQCKRVLSMSYNVLPTRIPQYILMVINIVFNIIYNLYIESFLNKHSSADRIRKKSSGAAKQAPSVHPCARL